MSAGRGASVVIGEPLDQALVPAHAVDEGVDPEVLVVRMDRLALRLGHPERGEPVDAGADRGEEPRVGGGHHDVRRGHRVGEHLGDRGLDQRERSSSDTARPGWARWPRHGRPATWSSSIVLRTCSSTLGDGVADHDPDVDAGRGGLRDHVERGRPGERGDRERRPGHGRRLGPGGDQGAGEQRAEPAGVGHAAAAAGAGRAAPSAGAARPSARGRWPTSGAGRAG